MSPPPNLPPTSSRRGYLAPLECKKTLAAGRWGSLRRSPNLLAGGEAGCPFPKNPTPLSPLTRIIGGLTTPNMMGWIRLCLLIYCRPTSSSTVFTALLHFLFNFVIDAWFSIQYCLTFLVSVKLEAVWKASLV